jgi:hypothetical protein
MGDIQRKTLESEWDKHKQHYQAYLGVQETLRNLIVGAVDGQYLRELNNEYTGFSQHRQTTHQSSTSQSKTHHHQ